MPCGARTISENTACGGGEQDLRRFRRERTKTVFHGAYIRTDKEKTVHCRSERRRRCENAGGHEPTCGEIAFVPDKRL